MVANLKKTTGFTFVGQLNIAIAAYGVKSSSLMQKSKQLWYKTQYILFKEI